MTSVQNVQQIVAVIRRQLAAGASSRAPAVSGSAARGAQAKGDAGDLLSLVARRVAAIDRTDPDRGRKAFRVFLESVLLAELDESLINDPKFYRVVDEIQQRMEADPEIAASVSAAVEHLLATQA